MATCLDDQRRGVVESADTGIRRRCVVAVEMSLTAAIAGLASAGSMQELLSAACAAADTGEATATALARDDVANAPGYLAAADAFAVVRVEIGRWADAPPAPITAFARSEAARLHRQLSELAQLLCDRLRDVQASDDGELAHAVVGARAAAANAGRPLRSGAR
jgi:hypothetical protein